MNVRWTIVGLGVGGLACAGSPAPEPVEVPVIVVAATEPEPPPPAPPMAEEAVRQALTGWPGRWVPVMRGPDGWFVASKCGDPPLALDLAAQRPTLAMGDLVLPIERATPTRTGLALELGSDGFDVTWEDRAVKVARWRRADGSASTYVVGELARELPLRDGCDAAPIQ